MDERYDDPYPDGFEPDYVSLPVPFSAWRGYFEAGIEAGITVEGIYGFLRLRIHRKALAAGAVFTRDPQIYRVMDPVGVRVAANGTGLLLDHVMAALEELTAEAAEVARAQEEWRTRG
jgi:hypothetical protein